MQFFLTPFVEETVLSPLYIIGSFVFSKAAPAAYGGSQARGPIGDVAKLPAYMPEPKQCRI